MIHFVGAGSGAVDLITVRGQRLLSQADLIIYAGSLVNPALLEGAKPGCQVMDSARDDPGGGPGGDVGGGADRAHDGASAHRRPPCVYGAIREQMDRLDQAGISYDVCPGVSAFCGAAAALNLEYTLPGVSQSVIITRMAGENPGAGAGIHRILCRPWGQHGHFPLHGDAGRSSPAASWREDMQRIPRRPLCTRLPGPMRRPVSALWGPWRRRPGRQELPRQPSSWWARRWHTGTTTGRSCTTQPLPRASGKQNNERLDCGLYPPGGKPRGLSGADSAWGPGV